MGAKRRQRNWTATHENDQVTVGRADAFATIDTAEWATKGGRSSFFPNESVAIPWSLVPQVIAGLQAALKSHEAEEDADG